ncbi:MAG: cohesin domain-containing protein [Patescibacteria group bacterium]
MKKFRKLGFLLLFAIYYLLFSPPSPSLAADFSFSSPVNNVRLGDEFSVRLLLGTEGETINAIEGKVLFPLNNLEVKEISDGNSLINLWVRTPSFDVAGNSDAALGAINFAGIIPGGYDGALGAGLILTVKFKAKNSGAGQIYLADMQALLNDGFGTAASVSSSPFNFSISEGVPASTVEVKQDRERPEMFSINLSRAVSLFDNRWFIAFSTQDKQSGINHYEVSEDLGFRIQDIGVKFRTALNSISYILYPSSTHSYILNSWQTVSSPYMLKDQKLQSVLRVKAVDNAGNERIVTLPPQNPLPWYENIVIWSIIGVLAVIIISRGIWRKKQNR